MNSNDAGAAAAEPASPASSPQRNHNADYLEDQNDRDAMRAAAYPAEAASAEAAAAKAVAAASTPSEHSQQQQPLTSDPRPPKTLPPGGLPTTEQMSWLNMMIRNKTITEIKNGTLTRENYGTYYLFKPNGDTLKCGVLREIIVTSEGNGGNYGYDTSTKVTTFVFYDSVTNKKFENRGSHVSIYLLPDTLPTSDPRLPKTLPPGGLPTTEQLSWLNMMTINKTIKEIKNGTLTRENYGTYYLFKPNGDTVKCGVLILIFFTTDGNGGNYGPDTSTQVTNFVFYDPVTNKEFENRGSHVSIYLLPDTLPTSDPRLPETLPPLPTTEQMSWLNMMIESGDIRESSKLTEANYKTYYLFKIEPTGILQGGFLFKIVKNGMSRNGWVNGEFQTIYYTTIQYVVYDPILKREITTKERSENEILPMYSLPDTLPTSEPRSGIFKRIIDVDDVTGNMTFYDDGNGSNTYAIPTNSNWTGMCIVEIDHQSGNHNMLDAKLLCSSIQKAFTGKIITTKLVEKICGKPTKSNDSEGIKRELYVKVRVDTNKPVINSSPLNPLKPADIEELHKIREKTKDVINTQGSNLCATRAKPVDKVIGPDVGDLAPVTDKELAGLIGRKTDFYSRFGEFAVKVLLASNADRRPFEICSLLDGRTLKKLESGSGDYLLVKKDFKHEFQIATDESIRLFESNLKKRISPAKKGDMVYFYKSSDTTKEYPLYGKVEVVNSEPYVVEKKLFGKNVMGEKNHKYDITYTDKETHDEVTETGVTQLQLYEPDLEKMHEERTNESPPQQLNGGKKNIKRTVNRKQKKLNGRKKTRRSVYQSRKSIKRMMRSKRLPRRITRRTRRNKQIKTIKH